MTSRNSALLMYLGDNTCCADNRINGICFGADSEPAQAQSPEAGQQYWENQRRWLLFCRSSALLQQIGDGVGTLYVWVALCQPSLVPVSFSHCVNIYLQRVTMHECNEISVQGLEVCTPLPLLAFAG